jgi:Tfp pilus assembly protein PilF
MKNITRSTGIDGRWRLALFLVLAAVICGRVQTSAAAPAGKDMAKVLSLEGSNAWMAAPGADVWTRIKVGQVLREGDRGRTGPRTRLRLRLADEGEVTVPERTEFVVEAPPPGQSFSTFTVLKGMSYFFHRGKPREIQFNSNTATAAIRGTEFVFAVDEQGRTVLTMLDGEVELRNQTGAVLLHGGEAGTAEPGRRPVRTAVLNASNAVNAIQWCLYYPAVLDASELSFSENEKALLADSLRAYEAGDLNDALARYPEDRQPVSVAERLYFSALLLAVGQVETAETWLSQVDQAPGTTEAERRLAAALRLVVAAVKGQPAPSPLEPSPAQATAWLAQSYFHQSQGDLLAARDAAQRAVQASPLFGFAWARLAELEFSFGRREAAWSALDRGLELSPRNAQAVALKGFLLSARNQIHQAVASFESALALDGGLGNAWLGRGLCRIRLGQTQLGLEDLEVAAATEPQRSVLRSYLGKAFGLAGAETQARKELDLARRLDSSDPTGWLYAALLNQEWNRINQAIQDLEASQARNGNRQIYRSRLLLDQDQAVRGANLARIYLDAGMRDVAFRKAIEAVHNDYANYSAHLFLANSYNQLRDPNQVNLRFESAWLSEYLVANLLAPPGAGALSQAVSQQEYGRLFERDRPGLVSTTEYLSRGDWTQSGAQFGRFGNLAYALDEFYQSRHGQRPNNDLEQLTLSFQFKQQITPEDSLFAQAVYYDAEGGDLAPVYDPTDPALINRGLRFHESQEPMVLAGYHHQWSPGNHTLLLAGRLEDTLRLDNPQQQSAIFSRDAQGAVTDGLNITTDQKYRSQLEIYTAEAQQIWERHAQTVILGSRYQFGQFETQNRQTDPQPPFVSPFFPALDQRVRSDFQRWSGYGYYQWRILDPLLLIGGLSYDWVEYPVNHRFGPVSGEEDSKDQVSPKAGLIWTPREDTTFRAGYAQALGGVSFDQSFRLEPSQVAGFNQSYRSLIPEAVAGSSPVPRFETYGLEWDQRLPSRTYLGVRGERLESDVDRSVGVFDLTVPPVVPGEVRERLDYEENTLLVTLNQLVGDEWALGAVYRLSEAKLHDRFLGVPDALPSGFVSRQDLESTLHQLKLFALFNHPSGFFLQWESIWSSQSNRGYNPDRPGDDFWQHNAWAGYRFYRRRAEVRLGLLNVTDQDYRLNPLNLTSELPRDRTLAVSLKLNF